MLIEEKSNETSNSPSEIPDTPTNSGGSGGTTTTEQELASLETEVNLDNLENEVKGS